MNKTFLQNLGIRLPKGYMNIRYNSEIIPDGSKKNIVNIGANCQVYVYELLRFNNKNVPDYRSSELWNDRQYSDIVSGKFQLLDILFINSSNDPYGAHLGIYIGENQVLHNSKDIGRPAIFDLNDFTEIEKYKVFIGAKRIKNI